MTPNLRFNKKMTKLLIKAMPQESITLHTLKWKLENTNNIYGCYYKGLFKTQMFFIQPMEDDMFRLLAIGDKGECNCYIIDDMESFMNVVGAEEIKPVDSEAREDLYNAVMETKALPNTGIIMVDEEESIYVYDHTNY